MSLALSTLLTLALQAQPVVALSIPPVAGVDEASLRGRHVVPLHRQRVPVKSDSDSVSFKSVYFGHITVGAPMQQSFSVVFDTGSGHVVLPSKWCTSETCMIHNRYDPAASANAVDVEHDGTPVEPDQPRDQITVAYGTGEVTGQFANDRLCLGVQGHVAQARALQVPGDGAVAVGQAPGAGAVGEAAPHCIELRIVMATEMTHEPFHSFAFDGVLGLGLDSLALAPEFSFFGMMTSQKQLQDPSFGVFLAESDDEVSEISFGGPASEHLRTRLSWAPVALPELGYWQVQIKSIRLGEQALDFCDDGQCRGVVDTGTSLLAVPEQFLEHFQETLEGSLGDPVANKDGSLDCKGAEGLEIVFEVEGTTLVLGPGDYSRVSMAVLDEDDESWSALEQSSGSASSEEPVLADQAGASPRECRPTIMPLDLPEPLGPKLFIFGEPVLRKYYTAYNWKEQTIGFALARHSSDEKEGGKPEPAAKPRRKPLLV